MPQDVKLPLLLIHTILLFSYHSNVLTVIVCEILRYKSIYSCYVKYVKYVVIRRPTDTPVAKNSVVGCS